MLDAPPSLLPLSEAFTKLRNDLRSIDPKPKPFVHFFDTVKVEHGRAMQHITYLFCRRVNAWSEIVILRDSKIGRSVRLVYESRVTRIDASIPLSEYRAEACGKVCNIQPHTGVLRLDCLLPVSKN